MYSSPDMMKIADIRAFPISFPVPQNQSVRLGIGRSVKRDAVLVRIETEDGHIGWGEAHHGRCPGAIAKLIDTTIRELVLGHDAMDVVSIWAKVFKMQLASHGMGAAACIALSGVDIALWDLRCRALQTPLYTLLGGGIQPVKAYAGGISLGWQEPSALADEAQKLVSDGYRALKLRVGDSAERDIQRVRAVRDAVGQDVDILVDANTSYSIDTALRVMPAFEEMDVVWLEEPFPSTNTRGYAEVARYSRLGLAAGENHYTRHDFIELIEAGHVRFLQPDLSKCGGVTEAMRIAALASSRFLSINPHTSATAINMATTLHFLSAIDNPGYFEGDTTVHNPFRDALCERAPYSLDSHGYVRAPEGVSYGLSVDTDFIKAYPLIEGPCYV